MGDLSIKGEQMGIYLYTARTADGARTVGRASGASPGEVRTSLESQSLTEITFHTDAIDARVGTSPFSELPDFEISAEDELVARKAGLGQFFVMIMRANLPVLLPLLAWNGWSVYAGRPFGWGDGLGFALTLLLLAFLARSAIPVLAFNRLLDAIAWGRWSDASRNVAILRRFPGAAKLASHQLDYYEARAEIGLGRRDAAFARYGNWEHEPTLPRALFVGQMAALHDAAREYDAAEALHRELATLEPDSAQPWIDLAALLARRGGRIDEAEACLREGERRELVPLAAAFAGFAQGILLIDKGEPARAVVQLVQAAQAFHSVGANPMLQLMRALVQAFLSVALLRLGRRSEAERMWRAVLPRMQALRFHDAIDRYAAAATGREWRPGRQSGFEGTRSDRASG